MPNNISFANWRTVRFVPCWSRWIWLSTPSWESDRKGHRKGPEEFKSHACNTHAQSFDRCEFQSSVSWSWPKGTWALGTRLAAIRHVLLYAWVTYVKPLLFSRSALLLLISRSMFLRQFINFRWFIRCLTSLAWEDEPLCKFKARFISLKTSLNKKLKRESVSLHSVCCLKRKSSCLVLPAVDC